MNKRRQRIDTEFDDPTEKQIKDLLPKARIKDDGCFPRKHPNDGERID